MEVAVIDWKNLDSKFVEDDLFEPFNAPQWVDFSAPDDAVAVDDEAGFGNRLSNLSNFMASSSATFTTSSIKATAAARDDVSFLDRRFEEVEKLILNGDVRGFRDRHRFDLPLLMKFLMHFQRICDEMLMQPPTQAKLKR
nr:hypothetical protein DM860_014579 [Ipomoea batatas]GMD85511.1 hypothetical protein DM860_014579 [Ipomoea batatas]GME04385.1 hypothetical protein DM860_014579 [Ipomoea batatas]GME19585.1 hypothetical protein DM860_014579 [Ipomoea batatas]